MTFKIAAAAALSMAAISTSAFGEDAKPAAADPMAAFYGNTLTLLILPFWSAEQYYSPDHTWRQVDNGGVVTSGVWSVENGRSCQKQTKPAGPTWCQDYTPHKLGDVWTNTDAETGNIIRIELVAGRK
jgi:hypothetical protein